MYFSQQLYISAALCMRNLIGFVLSVVSPALCGALKVLNHWTLSSVTVPAIILWTIVILISDVTGPTCSVPAQSFSTQKTQDIFDHPGCAPVKLSSSLYPFWNMTVCNATIQDACYPWIYNSDILMLSGLFSIIFFLAFPSLFWQLPSSELTFSWHLLSNKS